MNPTRALLVIAVIVSVLAMAVSGIPAGQMPTAAPQPGAPTKAPAAGKMTPATSGNPAKPAGSSGNTATMKPGAAPVGTKMNPPQPTPTPTTKKASY